MVCAKWIVWTLGIFLHQKPSKLQKHSRQFYHDDWAQSLVTSCLMKASCAPDTQLVNAPQKLLSV